MQVATNNQHNSDKASRQSYGMTDCTLVSENKKTVWVRLTHDGNIIKRHKTKHKIVQ